MERYFIPLLFTFVPLIATVVAYLVAQRRPNPGKGARLLQRTGWVFLYGTSAFLALIVVGELFSSEGVTRGFALMTPWAAALLILSILAVTRPRMVVGVLTVMAIAPLALATWEALQPVAASAWADARGPIELVLIYLIAVVAGITARREPQASGLVLLLAAGVPILLRLLTPAGELARQAIIASLAMPAAWSGIAFVLAARLARRTHAP